MAGGQTAARLSPAEMPLPDAPESAPAPVAYSTSLPGLPGGQTAVTSAAPQADGEGQQTKRILGIIPNFRSVSVDQKLPPMPVKEKFIEASQDSFDYSSIFLPAAIGGYSDARRATPEFGHGAIAYGRYFWHSAADQTIENYMVEFVGPALTHQDPRYYTKGRGGFVKRTEYSLSRVVITRTDDDRETFNSSEVFGALAAAGISNAYYPSPERGFGKTMGTFGTSVAIDAATFMFHEFWPDINQRFFHMKD
jgi:hypothetical protein